MIYLELLKALEDSKIRYVVVGGVAVVLHGFVRATMDLDIVISLETSNAARFLQLAKEMGYRPKAPVPLEDFANPSKRKEWKETKGMLVFSLFHSKRVEELVDIFVEEPIPFEDLYRRRVVTIVNETPISIASREDLKTLKKVSNRPQDLQDIAALDELDRRSK